MGYLQMKGKFLRFCGGYKNQGSVIHGGTEKGYYNPQDADPNFVIPSLSVLRNENSGINAKSMKPGPCSAMIDVMTDSSNDNKTYMLSVDGKNINGCTNSLSGCVDCFGFEPDPKKKDIELRLEKETGVLNAVAEFSTLLEVKGKHDLSKLTDEERDILIVRMKEVHEIISSRICDLRQTKVKKEYALHKLMEKVQEQDWLKSKYQLVISHLKTIIYQMEQLVEDLLALINRVIYIVAVASGVPHLTGDGVIDFNTQGNYVCLQPVPHECEQIIKDQDCYPFVKQRTETWFEIRKTARVTGSTAHKALAGSSLVEQRHHVDELEKTEMGQPIAATEVTSAMRHGTSNEINAIATLVSKVLPMYWPNMMYMEEGCYGISVGEKRIFVVSPDGSGRYGMNNPPAMAFEFKCPLPGKKFTPDVHYKIPPYYALQLMLEMKALGVNQLVYLCWTPASSTAFKVTFHTELWECIRALSTYIYGPDKMKKMTKVSPEVKCIRDNIHELVQNENFVEYLGEFPSVWAKQCSHENSTPPDGILPGNHRTHDGLPYLRMLPCTPGKLNQVAVEGERCIKTALTLTLPRATEVLVFILGDLDRISSGEKPHAVPVGYALKGPSLSSSSMRDMILHFLEKCIDKGLHVPCTAYHGQWWQLVVRGAENQPLTIVELMRDVSRETQKTSKADILLFLKNKVANGEMRVQDILDISKMITTHTTDDDTQENPAAGVDIRVTVPPDAREYIDPSVVQELISPASKPNHPYRDTIHAIELRDFTNSTATEDDDMIEIVLSMGSDEENGSDDEENSYYLVLPSAKNEESSQQLSTSNDETIIYESVDGQMEHNVNNIDIGSARETDPAVDVTVTSLFGQHDYESIHTALQNTRGRVVVNTVDDIQQIIHDKDRLQSLNVSQLKCIIRQIQGKLKQRGIAARLGVPKPELITTIMRATGDDKSEYTPPLTTPKITKKTQFHEVTRMKKSLLNSIYAKFRYPQKLEEWRKRSHVNDKVVIEGYGHIPYGWFSQPEYLEKVEQHHLAFIDPSHLLTNLRSHICRNGIPQRNIYTEAWLNVARDGKTNGSSLNMAHVDPDMLVDKQSVAMAEQIFSAEVEAVMESRNFTAEAKFCHLVREWYEAEDCRGISSMERLHRRLNMREWLLEGLNLSEYMHIGRYINGIPAVSFQGLLTNCERSIQLYAFVKPGSYNSRAKGTLENESLFGEFAEIDPRNVGYLNPKDVPAVISTAMELCMVRMNPDRWEHCTFYVVRVCINKCC